MILVDVKIDKLGNQSLRRHENGNDPRIVASLVKVLEVQRVVPNLINGRTRKACVTDLEFDSEDNRPNQKDYIDPAADPRDAELEEDLAAQSSEA